MFCQQHNDFLLSSHSFNSKNLQSGKLKVNRYAGEDTSRDAFARMEIMKEVLSLSYKYIILNGLGGFCCARFSKSIVRKRFINNSWGKYENI